MQFSDLDAGVQALGRPLLLSQARSQRAGLEVEQLESLSSRIQRNSK